MIIKYVKGDATAPVSPGLKVIAHIVNDQGRWGKGFVVALSRRWPEPEIAYRALDRYELGTVQLVHVNEDTIVANMCAQHGFASPRRPVAVDYAALGICLDDIANRCVGASVHCPRIGCGLGGGRWDIVETLLTRRLCSQGMNVTVYDL